MNCGDAYPILMTDSRKIHISMFVSSDEQSTVLEDLDEASTAPINFELPGSDTEYFGEAVTDGMAEGTAEGPDTPALDTVQKSNSPDNEVEDNAEQEDRLDPFRFYLGLRLSTQHTAGVPPDGLYYDTGLVSSEKHGNSRITISSSYAEAMRSEHKQYWQKVMQDGFASLNDPNAWKLGRLLTDKKAFRVDRTFDIEVNLENETT